MTSQAPIPPRLYRQLFFAIFAATMTVVIFYLLLQRQGFPATRWLILTTIALSYHIFLLTSSLHENRAEQNAPVYETLGLANCLSFTRGVLNSLLAGFLFSPFPTFYAWLPVILWAASGLLDNFDGLVARLTNRPTQLGAKLDIEYDAVGLLIIFSLLAWYGKVPIWYVGLGLARFLFVFGKWWREQRGLRNHALTESKVRRPLAGILMGSTNVTLWPIVAPPETIVSAYIMGLPFAFIFLRDWLVVSGKLNPLSDEYLERDFWIYHLARRWLPMWARVAIVYLLAANYVTVEWASFVGVMAFLGAAMVGLGVIGRLGSLLLLIPAVFAPAPLIPRLLLIVAANWITLFGNGPYSLWQPEEKIIDERLG